MTTSPRRSAGPKQGQPERAGGHRSIRPCSLGQQLAGMDWEDRAGCPIPGTLAGTGNPSSVLLAKVSVRNKHCCCEGVLNPSITPVFCCNCYFVLLLTAPKRCGLCMRGEPRPRLPKVYSILVSVQTFERKDDRLTTRKTWRCWSNFREGR